MKCIHYISRPLPAFAQNKIIYPDDPYSIFVSWINQILAKLAA